MPDRSIQHLVQSFYAAILSLVLLPGPVLAATPDRLAVVIGNQDYANVVDLGNARNDAAKMADLDAVAH